MILVRKETTAEDIHGMKAAQGILTEQGGMTRYVRQLISISVTLCDRVIHIFVIDSVLRTGSHAAVVARGMGKCCVSGCQEIDVSNKKETIVLANGKVGLLQSLPLRVPSYKHLFYISTLTGLAVVLWRAGAEEGRRGDD